LGWKLNIEKPEHDRSGTKSGARRVILQPLPIADE
jgi:hypothetical protein